MIEDADILTQHAETIRNLPRLVSALVIIQMTPEDLYRLGAAEETDQYWPTLSEIVSRIVGEA